MLAGDDPSTVDEPTAGRWACRPHFILVAAGLSVPLWCAILGGTALAVAGVRGLLEAEVGPGTARGLPEAEAGPGTALLPGGMLLHAGPPSRQGGPPAAAPPTTGLDPGPGGAAEPDADRPAIEAAAYPAEPGPPPDPARVDPATDLERRVREQVAAQLREFGLATAPAPLALSDASLDRVAAGQAGPAGADGGAGADSGVGADRDPQLDALNRVLVEKGGVLLPAWTFEVQPELLYSYKGSNGLLIVERDGARSVAAHDADLDRLETAVTARLGLPWRSQAEVRVPYLRVSEDTSDGLDGESRGQGGLGDVELSLSRQFLREDGRLPDLVGEVRWRVPTGDDPFGGDGGPATGSGFHGLGARVTLLKTYDPVVFLGGLAYTANLEDEKGGFDIDPGDAWSFNLAAVLAAGPDVSLRAGFAMSFTDEAEVDGKEVAGSGRTEGVLSLGTGLTLSPSTLLDVGVGIGVTDDAPDVTARVALAYRF
jgi:hypothetical protein